jgi:hypothetical protein
LHARHSAHGDRAIGIDVDKKAGDQNGNRPHEHGPVPLRIIQPSVIAGMMHGP